MQQSTNSKQREQLSTSNNADEIHSNNSLIERTNIEGTPFTLINDGEKEFLVMGNHRLTDDLSNVPDVIQYIEDNKWRLIVTVTAIVTEKTLQELGRKAQESLNNNQ